MIGGTRFLPQTVNFHVDGDGNNQGARNNAVHYSSLSVPPALPKPAAEPQANATAPTSLFQPLETPEKAPATPGGRTDHEHIFSPTVAKLKGAEAGGDEANLVGDSEYPSQKWGYAKSLTQPKPQMPAAPSPSILKHADPVMPQKDSLFSGGAGAGTGGGVVNTVVPQMVEVPVPPTAVRRQAEYSQPSFSSAEWTIERAQQGNGGLRNAVQSAAEAGVLGDRIWVGTLGMPTDALAQETKDAIAGKLERDYGSVMVYVKDSDFDGLYSHFCKTILWPIFHYSIPDNPKSKAYEEHSWIYYVKVNKAFAETIARHWKNGDSIWVHDYHLLLVPAMLRKMLPNTVEMPIGFFLHIAFPSSEVFRCLAPRKQLLEGMLGANLIAFQTDEYCRHFLQTCSRILYVEATNSGLQLEDRFVNVGTFPIGIDPVSLDKRRSAADVQLWVKMISQRYAGKRLIVSRDKMDQVRGIRQKLLSYELFLNTYPEWEDKVVLIQVATTTTEQPELETTVSEIATRINSTHSTLTHQPLVFLKQDLAFPQYLALISVADVLMVTSLREGMNLTSHEFVQCQDGKYGSKGHGTLILSEFTGSASVFEHHALLVNPWDYRQCSEAIRTGLVSGPEERKQSWQALHAAVFLHSTTNWVKSLNETLSRVSKEQALHEITAVPRLSVNELEGEYHKSKRRFLLVDYEGTLAAWGSPNNIVMTTPQRAIGVLNDLAEDTANVVYVTSSRMPQEVERLFQRVTNLGLIAENGCYVRKPGSDDWVALVDEDKTQQWKEAVLPILIYFQERIEGSWIEELHCSFIFHYANADDEAGASRLASECADQINDACSNSDVHAIRVERDLIVEMAKPDKASAAEVIWSSQDGDQPPDFLLAIGDGREDEPVFHWANALASSKEYVMTVTLGSRSTEAKATLKQGVTGEWIESFFAVEWVLLMTLLCIGVLSCLQSLASSLWRIEMIGCAEWPSNL